MCPSLVYLTICCDSRIDYFNTWFSSDPRSELGEVASQGLYSDGWCCKSAHFFICYCGGIIIQIIPYNSHFRNEVYTLPCFNSTRRFPKMSIWFGFQRASITNISGAWVMYDQAVWGKSLSSWKAWCFMFNESVVCEFEFLQISFFKISYRTIKNMQHPRTKKCSICNQRYAFSPNGTNAYDDQQKRFLIVPCSTMGCKKSCCYSCRHDGEDPFDVFNFELSNCTYCLHSNNRNKVSFNKKLKKCWFKQRTNTSIGWSKLEPPSNNALRREKSLLVCECSLLP